MIKRTRSVKLDPEAQAIVDQCNALVREADEICDRIGQRMQALDKIAAKRGWRDGTASGRA